MNLTSRANTSGSRIRSVGCGSPGALIVWRARSRRGSWQITHPFNSLPTAPQVLNVGLEAWAKTNRFR